MITQSTKILKQEILPNFVMNVEDIKKLECKAVSNLNITYYELMERAGLACYELALEQWPNSKNWLILCGPGNNGGDGYVIAKLAKSYGINVILVECTNDDIKLSRQTQQARDAWLFAGGFVHFHNTAWPNNIDLIIDALLGTGVNRILTEDYKILIKKINSSNIPVLAVDIPSGLIADTGAICDVAVIAQHTMCLISLKPGHLIGQARNHVGNLHHNDLGLTELILKENIHIMRYDVHNLKSWLKPRKKTTHKSNNGRLLVIGGDVGMGGAINMTAEAALRSGAGMVRVLTHKNNILPLLINRPELMVNAFNVSLLKEGIKWAHVIVIGPGLGQRHWGQQALKIISTSDKPMLWDADALNILSNNPNKKDNRIITPHVKEAARLLDMNSVEIDNNRLHTVQLLVKKYGGVVILKGASTVICSSKGKIAITDIGNAGMATAGMGDVLSGIIAAMLGQQLTLMDAACCGCVIHGATADSLASKRGVRGMLATDLFEMMWQFTNPEMI